jgi:hypothetical protein
VGIGSSLPDLRRAYGSSLVPDRDSVAGKPVAFDVVYAGARKDLHQAIEFTLSHGRVDSIRWGRLADVHADQNEGPVVLLCRIASSMNGGGAVVTRLKRAQRLTRFAAVRESADSPQRKRE